VHVQTTGSARASGVCVLTVRGKIGVYNG